MSRPADAETVRRQPPPIDGRDVRGRFQKACAIAHGRGARMSANELMELVLEHGLPPREERERILAAKLAEGEHSDADDDVDVIE